MSQICVGVVWSRTIVYRDGGLTKYHALVF